MRIRTWSAALIALALVGSSCSENGPVTPRLHLPPHLSALAADAGSSVVISQVYGGGGNAGAPFRNDFIELHNRSAARVSIQGWSVQYTSSNGVFSAVNTTALSGFIEPGQFLLVREAAGTNAAAPELPAPNFSGSIAMALGAGKVALVSNATPLPCSGGAPTCTSAELIDFVGYGGANGFEGTAPTLATSNTRSARRLGDGCHDNNDNLTDFEIVVPAPRNGASPPVACEIAPPGDIDHITVTPAEATIAQGATQTFTAAAFDAANQPVAGTFTWSLEPATSTLASIDPTTGVATGLEVGDVGIVATASGKTGNATLHVTPPVTPPTGLPETRFSEIHYDPFGADVGEAIEIEGPAGTDLQGWDIVLYNGNGGVVYSTVHLSGTIAATCGTRGVVVTSYPSDGIQNGSPDGFALVDAAANVVQFLSYEGSFTATNGPANGMTSVDIGVAETSVAANQSLQLIPIETTAEWRGPLVASFGACNTPGGATGGRSISFTGRLPSDPALPVGFEDQLFATLREGANTVETTFTWASATPGIATIDANGVMHALAEGTATFVATAADGTTGSFSLPMIVATLGGTAEYAGNAEFGIPTDGNPSDDFIITREQYTISYNHNRNTPNWVSYEFDATHFQQEGQNVDRCDCFTHDPALPASFTHLTTADYTGAGAFAGFGIDRGHMARSFDFTSGALDNARSYYFSNIVPQAADLNQGPWAILENYLGDRARFENKEVYVVDGVAGNKGTVKNEGKLVIPSAVWKVALVLPRNRRLAEVHDYRDIDEVVAVIAPNDPGVRNVDWHTYVTTVDAVEALSGYDLLDLLPDKIERAVESNTKPPIAVTDGPYASSEGSSLTLSGFGSVDPNGSVVSFEWIFGDGGTSIGGAVLHNYAQDGDYAVRLIATDNDGLADTTLTSAHVTNVAPAISPLADATLLPGETYRSPGSFIDPGADSWSATVDYRDGSGVAALPLSDKSFTLAHTYDGAGSFMVTVRVSDDDVTSTRTQLVTVLSESQGLDQVATAISDLVRSGKLSSENAKKLSARLDDAKKELARGRPSHADDKLEHLLHDVDQLVRSGRLTASDAAALRSIVERVMRSLSLQEDADKDRAKN